MNRDYTFELREVPPSAQEKINLLFDALRALFAEQYGGGTTSKYSPTVQEWIVQYCHGVDDEWALSLYNDGHIFTSKTDAERAFAEATYPEKYRAVPKQPYL